MTKLSSAKNWIKYTPYYLVLGIIFLIVYRYTFETKLSLSGDNADYYILAKKLASSNEYTTGHGLNASPHNHFPPGYPFVMSLIMRMGATSILAMKILNGFFLLISSFLFFQIVRRLTQNKILAFATSVIMLLNSHLLQYSSIMMSEISFMCFILLSIYLYLLWREKEFSLRSIYFFLLLIALITLLYIRTLGISLLAAFLIDLLIQKRFKAAGILIAFCLLAQLPWQMRSQSLGGNSYMSQVTSINPYDQSKGAMKFENWMERFKKNSIRYTSKEIPNALFPRIKTEYLNPSTGKPIKSPSSHWMIGIFIIILSLLGIWSLKDFRILFLVIFTCTLGILLLWPDIWYGIRFFLPLIPFTFFFLVLGVIFLFQLLIKFKEPLLQSKKMVLFLIPFALIQAKPLKALHKQKENEYAKNWGNYLKLGEWSKENLPEESYIACRKPGLMYCVSDISSSRFSYSENHFEFLEHLNKNKFTHVIVEQLGFAQTSKCLLPVLRSEPEKFKIVKQFNAQLRKGKNGEMIQSRSAVWLFEYLPEYGYQGLYLEGKRHGRGIYKYRDGGYIKGTWKNDTLQGPGVLKNKKGVDYQGSWKNGKKNGVFIIRDSTKTIETNWVDDKMQATGYLLDSEGNRVKQIQLK